MRQAQRLGGAWRLALVGALALAPAEASAQTFLTGTVDAPTCNTAAAFPCNGPPDCAGSGEECVFFDGEGVCARDDALFCSDTTAVACPDGDGPAVAFGSLFVCPGDTSLCLASADLVACLRSPDGTRFVRWRGGDCDGDGLANGREAAETACIPAAPLGVATADGTCTKAVPCASTASTCADGAGTCARSGDPTDDHRYCFPNAGHVFCCLIATAGEPDRLECPGVRCPDAEPGLQFCDPFPFCDDLPFHERVACLEGPSGFPSEPHEGDCDGDGVANGLEDPEEGRDPCAAEEDDAGAPRPDAGVPSDAGDPLPDAGLPPGPDAGPLADAGVPVQMDAATSGEDAGATVVPPRFGGGGGCACRATPPARTAPWLAPLCLVPLCLALVVARVRDRRPRTRRPR